MISSRLLAIALVALATVGPATAGMIQNVTSNTAILKPGKKLQIGFRLSQPARVTVTILDSDLESVRSYRLGNVSAGGHRVEWDGRDADGTMVPSEAYTWCVLAETAREKDMWEPPDLRSRPFEEISRGGWDPGSKQIKYNLPAPSRIWVRVGISMGACLRTLVEGEVRMAGENADPWDGLDESGNINVLDRQDYRVAIFGYRLPQPSVIVAGAAQSAQPRRWSPPELGPAPSLMAAAPVWTRRRAFIVADRLGPQLDVLQLDRATFSASLKVPASLRSHENQILQRTLSAPIRLKWFIDGHCAGEEVDAVLPSMITLLPEELPKDGGRHFITANVVTAFHQIHVGSIWIE